MSGGFGRGRIIEQHVDSSYEKGSHFARVSDDNGRNRNGNSDARDFFATRQGNFSKENNFGEHNRNNGRNKMELFADYNEGRNYNNEERFGRGSGFSSEFNDANSRRGRNFSRGGRGGTFSSDRMDNNGYSSNHETNNEFSGFSAERSNGFSSGYGSRNGKRRGSSSNGGRGGGFGAGVNLNDGDNFGIKDRTSNFSGSRGNNYGSSGDFDDASYDHGFGRSGSHSRGFRGRNFDHGFSNDRIGDFYTTKSNFNSGSDESDRKFGNQREGFSSRRGGAHSFSSNYNNDDFGGFGNRMNTGKTSFSTRNNGFNNEGRTGFDRSNFNSNWGDREDNDRGIRHLSDFNRDGRTTYSGRVFQHGDRSDRFSSYVPEDRSIEEMYNEDAENAKYEISDLDQEVTVTGVPQSQKLLKLEDWKNAGFGDLLLRNIIKKSLFPIPRRIQATVIPLIQNGWDIVGHAETGSGKTAAFVLPIINYIMSNGEPNNSICAPVALILAPTRELVGQLYNQTRKFADGTGVTVAKAYGQYDWLKNLMELERGCNMLFATMGRLKDFVEKKRVKLHNISFFVLDEADRMLNQDSFQKDIMDLVHSPGFPSVKDRQTLLFSATFKREVQELAAKILKENHAFVSNGKVVAANPLVEQNFIEVTSENKFDKLIELLEEDRMNNGDVVRTLVFVQRKKMADVIALNLIQKNIRSSSISGDRVQKQREEALADFRKGNIRVLVATDVCARGIDVNDLQHVINYDMPNDRVTYVHRIGRTGRLHRGKATSFINRTEQDPALIADIVQVVQEVQQIPPDFLLDIANERIDFMRSQQSGW